VQGVLCVNPGRLAKGSAGGTLAKIHILGSSDASSNPNPNPEPLPSRAKVQIVRI
jgi:hypothetical protein